MEGGFCRVIFIFRILEVNTQVIHQSMVFVKMCHIHLYWPCLQTCPLCVVVVIFMKCNATVQESDTHLHLLNISSLHFAYSTDVLLNITTWRAIMHTLYSMLQTYLFIDLTWSFVRNIICILELHNSHIDQIKSIQQMRFTIINNRFSFLPYMTTYLLITCGKQSPVHSFTCCTPFVPFQIIKHITPSLFTLYLATFVFLTHVCHPHSRMPVNKDPFFPN